MHSSVDVVIGWWALSCFVFYYYKETCCEYLCTSFVRIYILFLLGLYVRGRIAKSHSNSVFSSWRTACSQNLNLFPFKIIAILGLPGGPVVKNSLLSLPGAQVQFLTGIVNGVTFLISILDCSLLMYRIQLILRSWGFVNSV